jgi:hypothetical protein
MKKRITIIIILLTLLFILTSCDGSNLEPGGLQQNGYKPGIQDSFLQECNLECCGEKLPTGCIDECTWPRYVECFTECGSKYQDDKNCDAICWPEHKQYYIDRTAECLSGFISKYSQCFETLELTKIYKVNSFCFAYPDECNKEKGGNCTYTESTNQVELVSNNTVFSVTFNPGGAIDLNSVTTNLIQKENISVISKDYRKNKFGDKIPNFDNVLDLVLSRENDTIRYVVVNHLNDQCTLKFEYSNENNDFINLYISEIVNTFKCMRTPAKI